MEANIADAAALQNHANSLHNLVYANIANRFGFVASEDEGIAKVIAPPEGK